MRKDWPVWKLALALYIFVAAAVAINLFMLGLLSHSIGLYPLTPLTSLALAIPLGIPATCAVAVWVRHLLDEAASGP